MNCKSLPYLFLVFVHGALGNTESTQKRVRRFPDGFTFGVSTSAYQIEGAWDEDGKSENIWDRVTHSLQNSIIDNATGDTAANSYHMFKRDVEMLRELGLDYYRFSISWSRILPSGFPDKINPAGVDYYNNLINEMLKYNILPMVTLYHWDLPQKLQDMGGWTNPYIVNWFSDYTRIVFQLFGDRVKSWITINEPHIICYRSYAAGEGAPSYRYSGVADYLCAKNILLAHASAYHLYDQHFRPSQGGHIFISLNVEWCVSDTDKHDDSVEDTIQFEMGQYAHPIFSKTGDWPPVMKERVSAKSAKQGFFRSRLPEFTPDEVKYIRGTSDYFGLNHYSTYVVHNNKSNNFAIPSFEDDVGVNKYQPQEWFLDPEVRNVAYKPKGFYDLLLRVKEEYDVPIRVTENGFVVKAGLDDDDRVTYYYGYLNAMLDAMERGVDVRSYSAWSLMDNFEWVSGYTARYGLYEVDFEDELRPRTPRKSALAYKQIVRTRTLGTSFAPGAIHIAINEDFSST